MRDALKNMTRPLPRPKEPTPQGWKKISKANIPRPSPPLPLPLPLPTSSKSLSHLPKEDSPARSRPKVASVLPATFPEPGLGDPRRACAWPFPAPAPARDAAPAPPPAARHPSSASPHLPSFGGRTPPLSPPCWAPLGTAAAPGAVAVEPLGPPAPAHTAATAASRQLPGIRPNLVPESGEVAGAARWVGYLAIPRARAWAVGPAQERGWGLGLGGLMASKGPRE